MEQQSQQKQIEVLLNNNESRESFVIPPEVANPFQLDFFVAYLKDKEGKEIKNLDDDIVMWLFDSYSKPFRDYCDEHIDIAKRIAGSNGNISVLTSLEVNEMVEYIKNNSADPSKYVIVH